jgi:prevent-host-death family protein
MPEIENPVVSAFDAKTHFSRLLDQVEEGERVTITRRGKPIAQLIPLDSDPSERSPEQLLDAFRAIRNRIGDHLDIKELINEGRK